MTIIVDSKCLYLGYERTEEELKYFISCAKRSKCKIINIGNHYWATGNPSRLYKMFVKLIIDMYPVKVM